MSNKRPTRGDLKQETGSHIRSSKPFWLLLPVVVLAIAAGSFWLFHLSPEPVGEVRGVLLISIDTCRADHLSCYGYDRQTTPNIDALASRGVLFENAISPVPLTLPAHGTMLTGTSPLYHGVHDNEKYKLAASNVTLAERLRRQGFTTGAIISAFVLDSQFGLDQGFDTYSDQFDKTFKSLMAERKADEVSRHAENWLDEHHGDPFFLFLHYYDPHAYYEPPQPFAARFSSSPYAGEIAYTDHCIGLVIKKLKSLNVFDKTLIVITADHGEMLGEHGEETHGFFVYQNALKIPLIFKLPGEERPRRVKELVGLTDIVPTLCGYLGMEPPQQTQGRDLSTVLKGTAHPPTDGTLYCESFLPAKFNACSLLGVVTDRWKFIQTTRPELYDLSQDPGESDNLVSKYPQEAHKLDVALQNMLKGHSSRIAADSSLTLDAEARKRLESLGYVGGSGSESSTTNDFGFDPNRDDPKDLIEFHQASTLLGRCIISKQYDRAESLCQKLLAQRPDYYYLSIAMADIAAARDDLPAAELHLKNAAKLQPNHSETHAKLGFVLAALGKSNEAIEHYRMSLQIRPEQPMILYGLGEIYLRHGRTEQVVKCWRRALELKPNWPRAMNSLAWLEATHEDTHVRNPDEAIRLARRACELTGFKQPDPLATLAAAYAAGGKFDESVVIAEKALDLSRSSGSSSSEQDKAIAEAMRRLELYKASKPYCAATVSVSQNSAKNK
ncbi:MAG: sulfatase-like hydrolase/transferase [Pirellulales bacterium]|nr:sulfatase-like hydrolase/transferase [Pirellulales bacterium]